MEASVPQLQLTHLVLEGAVMSLCLELAVKAAFFVKGQKTYLIRALKITMAVTMIVKSSIFAAFSSKSLMHHCLLAGRVAASFYHISCLAGIAILLLRVRVIISPQKYTLFNIIYILILICRIAVSVFDLLYSRIWTDVNLGVCRYINKRAIGISYTLFDTVIDFYVSITITCILVNHIRRLHADHVGGNINLYKSVVVSNAIRTIVLSIVNLVCTVYYITANDNPIMVLVVWPIANIFFIVLVGYDTDITKSINQCRQVLSTTLVHNRNTATFMTKEPAVNQLETQHQLQQKKVQLSSVISEPITSSSIIENKATFPSKRRLSNISALKVVDVDLEAMEIDKTGSCSYEANYSSTCTTIIDVDEYFHQKQEKI